MHMYIIPGFRSLFGTSPTTYEDLVKDLPSQIIIQICVMLNGELNAPETHIENQTRLRQIISSRFSPEQAENLNKAFFKFRQMTGGNYSGDVFARRYLLAMILRELNRNSVFELADSSPQQEYNFLMAYLNIIDEVNEKDNLTYNEQQKYKSDQLYE